MRTYSVSQINGYLKQKMDSDPFLNNLCVRGELTNYKTYPSGHHYFSLKDEGGAIRCVMFRQQAATLNFRPENGMQVIACGRISVYPRDGQYQLYCSRLIAEGLGDLHLAFEQMKEKLFQEGLFDQARNYPLPPFPFLIFLITSPAGAAIQDMLRFLMARWPAARLTLLPVSVQGEKAAGEIARAIAWANAHLSADLIITGRGGGSMEDLWAFNEEIVARAIYASEIPVVSAVGHEPDVTISDYAADLRAATPSNAAELAVPDQNAVREQLEQLAQRLAQAMERRISRERETLNRLQSSRVLRSPMAYFQDQQMQLDFLQNRMASAMQRTVEQQQRRLTANAAALDAMSPLKVLGRGYSIAMNQEGAVLSSVNQFTPEMPFRLRLADGILTARAGKGETLNGREEIDL